LGGAFSMIGTGVAAKSGQQLERIKKTIEYPLRSE
jgi:hypothetical protein